MLNVKIMKLVPEAVIPQYAKQGDAGLDLTAVAKEYDGNGNVSYKTGLAFEIPEGYVGLLFPRSSNAKKDLILSNSVGVIDSGYRGDVGMKFKPSGVFVDYVEKPTELFKSTSDAVDFPTPKGSIAKCEETLFLEEYEVGERIGQIIIMPIPRINLVEVTELSDSERGTGSYGSTGA